MPPPLVAEVPDRVSQVTFFPASDATGENKVLIVNIKSVPPKDEDILKMEHLKRSSSVDSKRKLRSRSAYDKTTNKSTMTEPLAETSSSSQTSKAVPTVGAVSIESSHVDSNPCLKHAAQNITQKASRIPSEKVSLCNNCSKSMLSYIFLVQDFLDSLATEICGGTESNNCAQCLRQENRAAVAIIDNEVRENKISKNRTLSGLGQKPASKKSQSVTMPIDSDRKAYDTRKYEETAEQQIQRTLAAEGVKLKMPFHNKEEKETHNHQRNRQSNVHQEASNSSNAPDSRGMQDSETSINSQNYPESSNHHWKRDTRSSESGHGASPPKTTGSDYSKESDYQVQQRPTFNTIIEQQRPKKTNGPDDVGFHSVEDVSSPFSDGIDHIVTTLSTVEREVYETARNNAGWDTLAEPQERLVLSTTGQIASEAFVTMCRNNAEALGCLVVGTSLLLCRTSRTLCVLVSDGVSNAFRGALSSIFHVVQCVRAMDSLGTTKLALLEQPELGISFEKLNVWRLTQFNKCVFLNPDTLVIQNCDELFCHEELSAVADIGWPDCFNSGVFVFVPSQKTFWQLLEFAEKQGSYDGGDQGLLNSYYNNWADDINKKLSFIYNLMANVSYTYTPAFRQFGRNVKIVQFHGSFKPWHVKFYSSSGQIAPASTVHPTYVQFVHIWINIFRISALRQLSKEVQSYALSQEVICAVELLRFFPLPTESEAEFYLTPPSVRLRLAERKLQISAKPAIGDIQRRKSAEFPRTSVNEDDAFEAQKPQDPASEVSVEQEPTEDSQDTKDGAEDSRHESTNKSLLPGSEIGNYQGMKAWEQGRMDYQGSDSSENIIKRIEFLMTQKKR